MKNLATKTRISGRNPQYKETTDQEEVKKLINMFLDWKNNFLTVGRFAEYYSLTIDKANEIINKGRQLNEISTN